jgi:hypothetical protein
MSTTDALALLERHHRHLETLFDEVFEAEDAEQRGWSVQKAADQLAGLLSAEEQVLYPRIPADDPLRLQAERQHAAMQRLAAGLLALAPIEEEVEGRCRELHEAVLEHHRFEHEQLFPHAARHLPYAQRRALGTALAVFMVRLHAAGAPRRALQLRGGVQPPAAGSETARSA